MNYAEALHIAEKLKADLAPYCERTLRGAICARGAERQQPVRLKEETMSLDVYLSVVQPVEIYEANITHNLGGMAKAAELYTVLWRPEEREIALAWQLVEPLKAGLAALKADPEKFRAMNPTNGWGAYENLVKFVEEYLAACEANPDAEVRVSR